MAYGVFESLSFLFELSQFWLHRLFTDACGLPLVGAPLPCGSPQGLRLRDTDAERHSGLRGSRRVGSAVVAQLLGGRWDLPRPGTE